MTEIPCHEPYTLAAGDTISFRKTLPNHPASDGWSLKYELRGGAVPIEFTSTADGDSHLLSVAAAVTATWLPGDYVFAGYAELAGARTEFFRNSITITPDLETASGDTPLTTHAQRMLTKLELVLEGKAGDDILDSEIEGTVIRRIAPDVLFKMRAKYKREREGELAAENARNGRPTGRRITPRINVMFAGSSNGVNQFGAGSMFP